MLSSFKVHSGKKLLDYRLGKFLDLKKIKAFFQEKGYKIKNLGNGGRHVVGVLVKDEKVYFLKLATSEGISVVTQNEFYWNDYFNSYFSDISFRVPKNYDSGIFNEKYFYLITEYFDGKLLCKLRSSSEDINELVQCIPQVIQASEMIQQLPTAEGDYQKKFIRKVRAWFSDIPTSICKKHEIISLLTVVEQGVNNLQKRSKHGDFAPWHIFKLSDHKLGLIDGEHSLPDGVENYDICYFIQRVFSVLKKPEVAQTIFLELKKKNYDLDNLKTVLAARAIGGFLDESLTYRPDYTVARNFKEWVINGTSV